jgi:hypothetical protein
MPIVTCQKPCLLTMSLGNITCMVLRGSTLDDTSLVQGDYQARDAAGNLLDFRIDTLPVPPGQIGRITIRLKYLGPAPASGALPGAVIPTGHLQFEVVIGGVPSSPQDVPVDCSND